MQRQSSFRHPGGVENVLPHFLYSVSLPNLQFKTPNLHIHHSQLMQPFAGKMLCLSFKKRPPLVRHSSFEWCNLQEDILIKTDLAVDKETWQGRFCRYRKVGNPQILQKVWIKDKFKMSSCQVKSAHKKMWLFHTFRNIFCQNLVDLEVNLCLLKSHRTYTSALPTFSLFVTKNIL